MAFNDYETFGTPVRPRDYGVVLRTKRNSRLFVSPSRLAIAKFAIETPEERREGIARYASELGMDPAALEEKISNGLKKRTESSRGLDSPSVLSNATRYGDSISAKVRSSSGKSSYRVSLSQSEGSYDGVRCSCDDNLWSDVKGFEYALCKHASILHAALEADNASRKSRDDNVTGLLPSERSQVDLGIHIPDLNLIQAISGYSRGQSLCDLSREIVDAPECSLELDGRLRSGDAKFAIMRNDRLKQAESRYLSSARALEARLRDRFKAASFSFDGYGLEFAGTQYEAVGIRFRKGDQRLSLCFWEELPPLIVHKTLLEYDPEARSVRSDSPFARRGWYSALDDSTRKVALEHIIVPGFFDGGEKIQIGRDLRMAYEKFI